MFRPKHTVVLDFFTQQVQQDPLKTAIMAGDQSLNYQQLEELSNTVAAYFLALDLPKGSIIPLLFDRSIDYMAILLGTLKAGLAFLPLDPDIPQERLAHILLETQSAYLVTNRDIKDYANWHNLSVLASQDLLQQRSLPYKTRAVLPTDLAYVIYTSGSTGAPKGVMIEHKALAHFTQAALKAYAIRREDRVLQFAAYSFDTSLEEIMLSLAIGATLCLRSHEMIDSTQHFLTACDVLGITVLDLPTAFWHRLTYDMVHDQLPFPNSVATVIIGGEAAQTDAIRQWCAYVDPRVRLINTYGPTETTIAVTACELTRYPELNTQHNLIGQPLGHAQLYVLDDQHRPLPLGATGELWIGGECLARGYLQQDELTRKHFISISPGPNSIAKTGELRLYRTGDRAQWITASLLAFKGRQDRQVKLRGYRIELEEIEKVLQTHPQVKQCAVLYGEEDHNGFIAAFIIPVDRASINTVEIHRYLSAYLPSYMLPSQWQVVDNLLMTRHGKVDTVALLGLLKPKQSLTRPQTTLEEKLANIWCELLRVPTVTTKSHFFEMGGHSLLAMQLVRRIQAELNAPVTLRDLLENPNFADMLARVHAKAKQGFLPPSLLKVNREQRLPLSFGQEALWVFDQLQAGQSIAYNIAYAIYLTGQLNRKALEQALDYILQRHEILRTIFKVQEGVVHQSILEQRFHLNPEKITAEEWSTIAFTEASTAFDLALAPPLRIRLFEFSPNHHRLLIHHHHIIHDGYSIQLFKKELRHCYEAFCLGKKPYLPPLFFQYADYAFHQRAQAIDSASLAYWREKLHQAKPLILPLRKPRSKMTTQVGAHHVFTLDVEIIHTLRAFCHQHDCTLFAGIFAAFVILFNRYSGETDITVGTMISLRDNSAIENLVGFFLNAVLLRNQVDNAADFLTLLQQVKQTLLEASTHRFVPLDHLAQALKLPRIDNSPAIVDVMIAFHHFEQALTQFDLEGFVSEIEFIQNDTAKYGLAIDIYEQGQTLLCDIEYSTELYSPQSMALLAEHYTHLLQAITQNFSQPVSTYDFLTEKERVAYLEGVFPWQFNAELTVNDWFNAVVLNNPTAIAIQHRQVSLSYSALQDAADQLARVIDQQATLAGYTLKPDTRIAVYLDRSPDMLIAILAILKVGAAFVPLDPNYPEKRVQFILADAEIQIILTQSHYWQRLHALDPAKTLIEVDASFDQDLAPLPPMTYRPQDLAYVIYTSGTTGQPKGVMIEHRQVCHYIQWFAQLLPLADIDRVDFSTNIIFDASITNTLLSLCLGKTVVICDESVKTNPGDYLQYLASERINLIKTTPSYFNLLIKIGLNVSLPDLRYILIGGEAIQAADLQKWLTAYPQHLIYNSYGPTETTVTVSKFKIDASNVNEVQVNVPIEENSRIGPFYILDAHHHLVPDHVWGSYILAARL